MSSIKEINDALRECGRPHRVADQDGAISVFLGDAFVFRLPRDSSALDVLDAIDSGKRSPVYVKPKR